MTTLAITPNWKNKTAKFKGTVAAGEHVSVTIQNENGEGGEFIDDASTLRLRVVDPCNGRTLAIFPEPVPEGETPETWDADLSPLRCTLNLNTVQMLKAVPPAANVPLLWVLDDYENKTLYFKEQFPVEHWPRLRGEEEPTDLDNYKDIIADFNTRLSAAEQTVATAAANAQSAANSASAAASSAATAATAATDAQAGAIASKNAAQTAADNAATSAQAASEAEDNAAQAASDAESARDAAATSAAEAAESAAAFVVDDTLSVEGAAADAKAVGESNQDLITQIGTVQDNLNSEVTARETLAAAVGDNRQNLAAEIARAQGAEQGLENRKADKATTYTKTEVDTKIAGVQTFKKYLVQTLPDPDEADMKGLYLVPTGETSEEGDLCEEWTVVEDSGEKRWEKIGGTTVDLSDYYDKDAVDNLLDGKQDALTFDNAPTTGSNNPVKSGGIWSAIWGALAALPAGFTSLYDWCVAQIAPKAARTELFPAWAANTAYTTYSLVIHENAIYKCTTEHTSGAEWDSTKWAGASGAEVLAILLNYLALSNKPQINGNTLTGEGSQSGADLGVLDLAGGTMTGGIAFGTEDDYGYLGLAYDDETHRLRIIDVWNENIAYLEVPNTADGSRVAFMNDVGNAIAALLQNLAPNFSTSSTYALNSLCVYNSVLYRCTTAVTTAGAWTGSTNWSPATVEDVLAALRTGKANRASPATAGNLAALDANGNPTDSEIPAVNVALKGNIPYTLGTPIVINTAYSEVVEGETIYYGSETLEDRTANIIQVTAATPLDELRITFPSATSGKVRDFGLRVEIGTGSAALAAPALVPIAPTGETIKIENNAKEIPALADGTATAKGVTLLYFSENAPGVFVVKGEQVEEVA